VSQVGTIAKRELAAYFFSPVAYVVLTLFLWLQGYAFFVFIQFLNQPTAPAGSPMQLFFGGTFLFWLALVMVCALLPMRLLAEESRSGTLELLLTAPVTSTQVVLGKWLAAVGFYVVLWLPTLVYVALLWTMAPQTHRPALGPIASGYLGTLLVGSAGLALGTFASALTSNQIVAAVTTFVGLLGLVLVGLLELFVESEAARGVIAHLNLLEHMEDFGKGIVDTRSVVYLASVAIAGLVGAVQLLDWKRSR
jgi:ABC-2 type transport system permease protein